MTTVFTPLSNIGEADIKGFPEAQADGTLVVPDEQAEGVAELLTAGGLEENLDFSIETAEVKEGG
jgi:hypothetical protein